MMLLEARERGKDGAKEGREPSWSNISALLGVEVVVEGEAWRERRGLRREGKKEEEEGCGCLGGCGLR